MKDSRAILPIAEYETLLVGRLDANYVGTTRCLSACHEHDGIRRDFEASTMGAQLRPGSGMPLVDCESCHGPGSLAIEGLTPERIAADAAVGKKTACDYSSLIILKDLPKDAQSLLCLKCHTANATFNIHAWKMGAHAMAEVSCFDCHNVHAGPDLIVSPAETDEMCYRCHEKARAEFMLPSRHPMGAKMFCTDCHDAHGTFGEGLLRGDTAAETCVRCHAEYEGPFAYEHAELGEDCLSCHAPHGAATHNILKVREPYLCLQCHMGHRTSAETAAEARQMFYTRCTDCHGTIHGTDKPSTSGRGLFTN
jgi:DmsE family decaheme c-type cytochrome